MSQADEIRQTAFEKYILPARVAGEEDVIIRAGDLHGAMKLTNAMPAVCSALRSGKFEQLAEVRRLDVTGPANGANVYFRFGLAGRVEASVSVPPEARPRLARSSGPAVLPLRGSIDLSNALVLVSCVKSKLPHPAPARVLYCSDWFTKVRRLVEGQNARWFVLSALHGLVSPDKEIAPYELTLNTMGVARRRAWADGVYKQLETEFDGCTRVVFFAGLNYREFLVGPLLCNGFQVDVPMEGLAQGEQLSWLGNRE
jgi:hypothetical protein